MSDVQNTPVNRNCLACAFPFWDQLTPEEQAQLCPNASAWVYAGLYTRWLTSAS